MKLTEKQIKDLALGIPLPEYDYSELIEYLACRLAWRDYPEVKPSKCSFYIVKTGSGKVYVLEYRMIYEDQKYDDWLNIHNVVAWRPIDTE